MVVVSLELVFFMRWPSSMIMWNHLILLRMGRSLMIYSYVVSSTWNLPCRILSCCCLRAFGGPLYSIRVTDGAHFSNSRFQLVKVLRGTMTRYGPFCSFLSIR